MRRRKMNPDAIPPHESVVKYTGCGLPLRLHEELTLIAKDEGLPLTALLREVLVRKVEETRAAARTSR